MRTWIFIFALLVSASASAWAGAAATEPLFRMNRALIRESDPVWDLLKRDSFAGEIGRMAVTLGSGIEKLRVGYKQNIGPFLLHVREADMPGERPGIRSSLGLPLIGRNLRLDLRNDAILDRITTRSVQSARVLLEFRL